MLEQHPVPQNVTSFQFRLIGDMTLKQFGYLAGGAILAYIAYNLPLPFFFAWPLAAMFGLGGIGFAFVPVEQRPMDIWFLSFVKSVYSPTLYIWQRDTPVFHSTNTGSLPLPKKTETNRFWETLFVKKKQSTTVSTKNLPNQQVAPTPPPLPAQQPIPHTPLPPPPPRQNEIPSSNLEKKLEQALADKKKLEEELLAIKQLLFTQNKQAPPPEKENTPVPTPFSFRPAPNIISGTVKLQTGELLHSILVTVKDKDDVPLRALKTNKMGQFASSTSLPNGTYTIDIEDPRGSFFFQPVQITLTGQIVDSVNIVAKSKQDLERQKLEDALFGKKP